MAPLPVPTADSSHEALARLFAQGLRPADVARRLAPDDEKAQKRLRARFRYQLKYDERMAAAVAGNARMEMLLSLGPAVRALGRQAKRRPDAVKLLLEASGFHNPRVQHEHSGEIKVKLDMPRPKFVDAQVEDAEVVEPS